jgi:hypothetical protein
MRFTWSPDQLEFPRFPQTFELRSVDGYYRIVLKYLQNLWEDISPLYSDLSQDTPVHGAIFTGIVKSFSHFWMTKQHYGAATAHRGRSSRYAYMDGRVPVEIQHVFQASQEFHLGEPQVANFAVVQRFLRGNDIPEFPWQLR